MDLILKKFSKKSRNGTLHFWPQTSKNKRSPSQANFLYFLKRKLFLCSYISGRSPKKTFYISGGNLQSLKIKKKFNTFPFKEAKFCKLRYFFIIIKKHLFLFYVFFYTQQAFVFHFLRDFCNGHNHIVVLSYCFSILSYCFSSLERFCYLSETFFCSLSLFSWLYLDD